MHHGDMGHGHMDMGGQCSMNVCSAVSPVPSAPVLMYARCSSRGLPTIYASFFANGESLGRCL